MSSDRRAPAARVLTGVERNARPRLARIGRSRLGRARLATLALAACAVMLALGAASANASISSTSVWVPVTTFGSSGSGAGQLQSPVGVAAQASSGNVYVADSANARVEEFGPTGSFIAAFGWGVLDGKAQSEVCTANCQAGIPGSGPGQFSKPTSIATGVAGTPSGGKLYVGDQGNNVVEKFDNDGTFLSSIDGSTTPQGRYSLVAGVSVDQSGNLWTADGNTDNITEFDPSGKFVQQWTDPFGFTVAIAVDSTHNAVYLIRGAQTTERFTLTGGNDTDIDNVSTGTALAVDRTTGNLFVDHGSSVSIFDPTGTQIDSLTLSTSSSQGIAFAPLPGGSAKPGLGNLYVTDTSSNNVTGWHTPPPVGPPFVVTESETGTSGTTGTLNATIVPAGFDTTCTFQYVSNTDFQASGYTNAISVPCTPADLGSSLTYQQASANISGLTVGAFYHFRAVATNSAGTTNGADQTFQAGPGDWTPYFRCPVDDPAMLATDGGVTSLATCVASNSTHGSITIGNITTATGNTNLQFGAPLNESTGVFSVIPPAGGALVEDPVQLSTPVGPVTALTESAGAPSNFCLFCGISLNQPIVTVPIKIQLANNSTLGPSCFIGSDQNPIVLNPENTDLSGAKAAFENFDANGTPDPNGALEAIVVTGLVQGDNTFAVPGATGCGPNGDGSLDAAVNAIAGLPSASGSNHLTLNNASSAIAVAFGAGGGLTGQQFAAAWHSAFG